MIRILAVDDEPDFLMMVSLKLRKKGYEVTTAKDGEEALVRLEEALPDLVLLDIRMPKLNGFEVFARMKENPKTAVIPVIFTSADATLDVMKLSLEAGAFGCLIKPFEGQEMLDTIRKCFPNEPFLK